MIIEWKHHPYDKRKAPRKGWSSEMWTADVGSIKCTITPPQKHDPLPMYWWETAGPKPYWNRRGGCSGLGMAKQAVEDAIAAGEKKACADPDNITNLGRAEVGI